MLLAAPSPHRLLLPTSPCVAFAASDELRKRRVPASRTPKEAAVSLASSQSVPPPPPPPAGESEVDSPPSSPLRGSDVLQALQRAVAAKEARREKKRSSARRIPGGGGRGGGEGCGIDEISHDYSHVRPIEVRSHWAQKMDELERRIQELMGKHH